MVQKARNELQQFKNLQQNQTENRSRTEQAVEENLARKVQETKEWYKKRKTLIEAGPKFLRHAYSPFGNALLVSSLNENVYAVFSSKNTVELWEKKGSDFEIRDAFEIPGSAMRTVLELYHQEMLNEADYLAEVLDPEQYLVGIRQKSREGTSI
jgi:hypothetical protein